MSAGAGIGAAADGPSELDRTAARALIDNYVSGWRDGDVDRILAAMTDDCLVIESHGPTYRGIGEVKRWAREWFAAGGRVTRWEIVSFALDGDAAAFEWDFECVAGGTTYALPGMSAVRFRDGRIAVLHEYRMTGAPFDWFAERR